MLRVIGPRALIEPLDVQKVGTIALTDREIPILGRVVGLGTARCHDCGQPLPPDVAIGATVIVSPTVGQEITVDGQLFWLVPLSELGAEWKAAQS